VAAVVPELAANASSTAVSAPAATFRSRNRTEAYDRAADALFAVVSARLARPPTRGGVMIAIAGTGYGLIGVLVIILLVVLIFYFVRRA
jgi:hypothetical protein